MMDFEFSSDQGSNEVRPGLFQAIVSYGQQNRPGLSQFADQVLAANQSHVEALWIKAWIAATDVSNSDFNDALKRLVENDGAYEQSISGLIGAIETTHSLKHARFAADQWLILFPQHRLIRSMQMLFDKRLGDGLAFAGHMKQACRTLSEPLHFPASAIYHQSFASRQLELHRIHGERVNAHQEKPERQYFTLIRPPRLNGKGRSLEMQEVWTDDPSDPYVPALRLTAPFSQDCNHVDGIGFINTVVTWGIWSGGGVQATHAPLDQPAIDLRNAVLRIRAKFDRMDAKAFKLALLVHTIRDIESNGVVKCGALVLTSNLIDPSDYGDGEWVDLEFKLSTNEENWQQAGGNPEINTDEFSFVEASLDEVLGNHRGTFALVFINGQWPDIVEGIVSFHWAELELAEVPSKI